jgi:hypothetical protein
MAFCTGETTMHGFSPEQTALWDAWQHTRAVRAGRSDRIASLFAVTLLAAALTAVAVAIWR